MQKIIGVRPGEKIHELLFSSVESSRVKYVKDHYVILPHVYSKKIYKNNSGEVGKNIIRNFEYSSETNKKFLSINEIKKLNEKINL